MIVVYDDSDSEIGDAKRETEGEKETDKCHRGLVAANFMHRSELMWSWGRLWECIDCGDWHYRERDKSRTAIIAKDLRLNWNVRLARTKRAYSRRDS